MKDSVWILVPTVNERRNLDFLLPQLLNLDPAWQVLVVDDKSTDGTQMFLRRKFSLGVETAF